MKHALIFPLLLLTTLPLRAGEPLFIDPFTATNPVPERRALRGDWQIENGVAQVTQDDALYKKHKDHGPILFYDFPATRATYHYAVKDVKVTTD